MGDRNSASLAIALSESSLSVDSDDPEAQWVNQTHVRHRRGFQRPPLLVKLTGYRLLFTVVVVAFGLPKAIASYQGGSTVIPTTLDWVMGIVCTILLYWLGSHRAAST
ncbi:hypothetical protein BV25DRAFT_1821988 [Artomyces pyxidatus]|uniref:Uncharacterized protein n=1 Tax=Artomyces pyxidatus TaxID=48021 RepID=A0ACB8TBJ6_9AGAM|nr:hypothetical protein BV25DRAFT_1821988 [Artomyces pyxidatus]